MEEQDPDAGANWAEFRDHLRRYLRARVSPAEAEDIAGEILLRLVVRAGRAQPGRPAPVENTAAWLSRVASNALTDHYRRRAAEARAIDAFETESRIQHAGRSSEAGPAAASLADCIVPLIGTLPATYRDALRLTEIEGLTQARAAGRLNLGLSAMKTRVQRGRRRLRRELLACCRVIRDRRGEVIDWHRHDRPSSKSCSGTCEVTCPGP